MKAFRVMPFAIVISIMAICASAAGSVLEKATKIQVDPTVVGHPENVDDSAAANLARIFARPSATLTSKKDSLPPSGRTSFWTVFPPKAARGE